MTVSLSTDQRPSKKHPLSFTINTLHNGDDPWPIEWMMFNYVNASAFAARVHAARAECPLSFHALYAIGIAAEGFIPGNKLLPCHLIGGAQWIILATEWLWGEIWWGKIDFDELEWDGSKCPACPPAQWARWLRGFQKMAATGGGNDVKLEYWAALAVTKMEEMMQSRGFTAEMMEAWDPEERSLFANMWEGEKYTYLFKVPQKA
ncbi:hypothetical protein UCDDA912_g00476 [Diaporthe ampelina]|uniref:Uncharacterized protein n=1 Tax=Diaporthe ampelina TaxID=1214573 RepID=A0A0G2FZN4_9PEZI|nr:hypothetical protein UCDDA912_g00476 [Diaporthe ampelina]